MEIDSEGFLSQLLNRRAVLLSAFPNPDQTTMDRVIRNIQIKLRTNLGAEVRGVEPFGSYTRDTNLARRHNPDSDIDLLVIFKHDKLDLKPETYRNHLKKFADAVFPSKTVEKRFPSIVIEQDSINLDLVPCIFTEGNWRSPKYYIPDANNEWQETVPHDITEALQKCDKEDQTHIRKIIRLVKYWNIKTNAGLESYYLEGEILDSFSWEKSLGKEFIHCVECLDTSQLSESAAQRVESLQEHVEWISEYIDREENSKIAERVKKILPDS